jgi:hypothetical protein
MLILLRKMPNYQTNLSRRLSSSIDPRGLIVSKCVDILLAYCMMNGYHYSVVEGDALNLLVPQSSILLFLLLSHVLGVAPAAGLRTGNHAVPVVALWGFLVLR